ncbi:MAG: phage tail tape measure protein, partial [Proteobacteria bacterium]|nr:phage tail tape measure protein [Pseudomonadota bacterium]
MASKSAELRLSLLDGVTGPARRVNGALAALNRQTSSIMSPLRGLTGSVMAFGAGYIGVTKGISSTVGAAIEFESAFADVRKVVDASDEQFANMSRTIKSMSRELPMTSVEIAQLFAAAGESGVATSDLKAFAEMAARVGIAFDMSAGEAGESLAKLKTQLGLNVAEVGDMADAINHLSNNMASKAKDITSYMLRVGSLADMAGFAKEEIAAIGSAMIAAGAPAEVAGTAMQNVVKALTKGNFAKKEQRDAAKAMGLDLPTIAKQMQKDAPKALKTVLTALAKAPKDQQIALLSQFFGDEAKAFAPLIGNIGLLDQALDSVADKSKYSGSAFNEFVARSNTTANALQILRNKIAYVFEDMGEAWLPTIKEGVAAIGGVLDTLGERAGIFDKLGTGLKGFLQGLGYDGGVKEAIEGLGDLLFGEVDGDGAADKLGRIFKQFEGYGASIRQFKKDLDDNPIVQFFADLSPYYL